MDDFGVIYSPKVLVFRSNEALGYDFLIKPYSISIVTAAMYKRPKFNNKTFDYKKEQKPDILQKLRSVLRVALANGHDSIVLSAWFVLSYFMLYYDV